ncbi:hypothetical protein [Leptospira licerasiae]|nr:hypothetical protein [Leptospira licerasiae]EIE01484.1 hypothetical protein LEP1GSC185_3906 [Leptospira licerasiae serovar Varillal str. VAR 010]
MELPLPYWLRIPLINALPIPTLFLPLCFNYIVLNYIRPYDLVSIPMPLRIFHTISIVAFSVYAVIGIGSPYELIGNEVMFRGGTIHYLSLVYIYGTLTGGLTLIVRNMLRGSYFEILHSIFLFAGILLGAIVSSIFVLILPLAADINLHSLGAVGLLFFLWFTWVPIAHYRLFNQALPDFGRDIRSPKFSNMILEFNRKILQIINPVDYKKMCDEYEKAKLRELKEKVENIQISSLSIFFSHGKQGPLRFIRSTSERISKLFFG